MLRMLIFSATVAMLGIPALADSRSLPVPSTTLYPGDAIDIQSLQFKVFTGREAIWRNYVLDAAALQGKLARRTLVAGSPIAIAAIKDPDVVKRGVLTRATLNAGTLEITAALMPLQSAAAGQTIEARNMETGITINATAMPDGSLMVAAP